MRRWKKPARILCLKPRLDQGILLTCCTSCGLMLKMEIQEMMGLEHMEQLAAHTYDASEYLLELHGQR